MSHTDFTGNKLFGGTSLAFWFGKKTTSAIFLCAAKDVPKDACKLLFHFFFMFFFFKKLSIHTFSSWHFRCMLRCNSSPM